MAFFKVEKKMMYTEVVWVETDSLSEAEDLSGSEVGETLDDDHWYDSDAREVSKEEYEENT